MPMGVERPDFFSPAYEPLAGTPIGYELDRQVRFTSGLAELGRFSWAQPVELVLQHPDDVFAFNLALSQRPSRARISPPGQTGDETLETIGRVLLIHPASTFRLSVPSGHVRSLYCGIECARLERMTGSLAAFHGAEAGYGAGADLQSRLNGQTVELLLNRIYEELRDAAPGFEEAVDGYATALCVELARAIRAAADAPQRRRKGGLAPGRMRLLQDRFHADAPAPRLAELAELCGMTVRQLSRAFKQETGKTLGKHIDEITVDRAFRLLTASHLPLAEIAAILGFSSQASFSYAFRRMTGLAPSEWRRRNS